MLNSMNSPLRLTVAAKTTAIKIESDPDAEESKSIGEKFEEELEKQDFTIIPLLEQLVRDSHFSPRHDMTFILGGFGRTNCNVSS